MFIDIGRGLVAGLPALALPPAILDAVERGAWIVFNLSGGKDSSAAMFAVNLILDALGHPRERRIAIHADLGRAEWDETPATVEDLAAHAGVPLTIVRRNAGDLFDRWATRCDAAEQAARSSAPIVSRSAVWRRGTITVCPGVAGLTSRNDTV